MPASNTAFTSVQIPSNNKKSKTKHGTQRHSTPVQNIKKERKGRTCNRCWITFCMTFCITLAIVLAGLLPALIVTLTQSSTSNTASSNTNTGGSSAGSSNTTTGAPVTTVSSATGTGSSTSVGSTTSAGSSTPATVSAAGFTVSGSVPSSTTAYYGFEDVYISCTVNLINITITITVQKTINATYRGDANTFWSGVLTSSYIDTGTQIIYTWTINGGQTIQSSGSPYHVEAQFYLPGISQTTSADTYRVTATTVTGLTSTVTGTF